MIASLRGEVLQVGISSAVIDVAGVGYQVLATPNTLSRLQIGHEVHIWTSLVVREDSMTLFGFASTDEKSVFETLTGVSGIGPKIALAVLAVFTPDELRRALASRDEKALGRVPGIGKKSAQRMILEIGDKLGPVLGEAPAAGGTSEAIDPAVLEGLISLGWRESEAEEAIRAARENGAGSSVPELLRAALQVLGSRR
ncbi:Holliday junction DNA helicase RuvA [Arcanobacterium wilhelmae]|uniref:Holliday junction branch migration complex subunit RuvA n=1 Tax=Arcanobacterium wilhelmae TaxID=1803177 RepID=A0ABT9N8N2_9ACTO|nr:Holliday junction branch migration protein RuvA [Arcanobacterium wilhelmae]MDP9800064.1 Holliday junction DNA helicase RuvA [Arcanobacterium wilhelmae]WFN89559.1 Holliday junction branch migration protein RuvA [Arcanobacterium wilhelmae]